MPILKKWHQINNISSYIKKLVKEKKTLKAEQQDKGNKKDYSGDK